MQNLPFLDYSTCTDKSNNHNQANPNKRKIDDEFSVEENQPKRFKASTDGFSSKEEKKCSPVKSAYQEMKNEEDQWMRDSIKNPFSLFVTSKSGETEKKWIEIQEGENTTTLNIDLLSRDLFLKKSKIREVEQKGKLSIGWLNKNEEKAKIARLSYDEELSTKIDPSSFLYSHSELMEKIRSIITRKPLDEAYLLIAIQNEEDFYIRFNTEKQKVVLSKLELPFAEGGFGAVRIFSSFHSIPSVFKQACSDSKATECLKREYQIVCHLHKQGPVWGIQEKPYELIHIEAREYDDSFSSQIGYLGAKYDYNYSVFFDLLGCRRSFYELFIDFHQLLAALAKLEQAEVLHGDIKPDNILVRTEADGTRLVHLADFGTAVMIHDEKDEFLAAMTDRGYTEEYSYKEDGKASKEALANGNFETVIEVEHKRDVFSMGSTLYFILTGKMATCLLDNYPDLCGIDRKDVPHQIKTLILSMIHPDPTKRPTAQQAFETYDTFLYKNYHPIYEKIRRKIEVGYPGSQ